LYASWEFEMQILGWLRWRITDARVRKAAAEMIAESGDHAFFASHEEAWKAHAEGEFRKAEFKRAVCREIARTIQRREVLRAIIRPARSRQTASGRPRNPDFAGTGRRAK
jgi:hypothetical protein